jgi:hypothetical protein
MRDKRPACPLSEGRYFSAKEPTGQEIVVRVKQEEDLWADVRSMSPPAKAFPTTASAPEPEGAPLPIINDAGKNMEKRPRTTDVERPRDPRLLKAQKKATTKSIPKTGEMKDEAPRNQQHGCRLVWNGSEFTCKLEYTEETTNKEVNKNTTNAKKKITTKAAGNGVIQMEVCGLDDLKLGNASGKCDDPFLVMQLACRGLGPALSLYGKDILQLCKSNYALKQVMTVRLDGEHKLYLVSLKTLGSSDGTRGCAPSMYGFLVEEEEVGSSGRSEKPSLVRDIVLQTMIEGKLNVAFDLGILLQGGSLRALDTKEKVVDHMKNDPLFKYFADSERRKYSNIRYYAQKKDTDCLPPKLRESVRENLLDLPEGSSSSGGSGDDDANLDLPAASTPFPLTVMFGMSDHDNNFVDKMGEFVQDVRSDFYRDVKNALVLEKDWSFDMLVKEKRSKFRIEMNAADRSQLRTGKRMVVGRGRQETPPPVYHNRDRVPEAAPCCAPQQEPNMNYRPSAAAPDTHHNSFVETNTVVTQQRVVHTQQQTAYQTMMYQPKWAESAKYHSAFLFDKITDALDESSPETYDSALKEILAWQNGQDRSAHGAQNGNAQLMPAEQNYDQHNQVVAQQGYWQQYQTIDPQESDGAYVSEIKRVFPPEDVHARGGLKYNCIAINLSPEDWRYIELLPRNKSEGRKQTSNMGRLHELLNQVTSKSFVAGIVGTDVCSYNAYCIAKIRCQDSSIALGIGLGHNQKIAKQAAAKVVLETLFGLETFKIDC